MGNRTASTVPSAITPAAPQNTTSVAETEVAADAAELAHLAFDLIENGLNGYAVKA
ncbi:hypothetical protein AB0D27_33345 [Streptomyces sp. NPDC048415]|uniref:hypothetical protein n=1 Tax=Streptomyces sp. NPDC048415 TaxID=3154822 RepID=UPI003444A439